MSKRPEKKPVDWTNISTPELVAKQSEAYGYNQCHDDDTAWLADEQTMLELADVIIKSAIGSEPSGFIVDEVRTAHAIQAWLAGKEGLNDSKSNM